MQVQVYFAQPGSISNFNYDKLKVTDNYGTTLKIDVPPQVIMLSYI